MNLLFQEGVGGLTWCEFQRNLLVRTKCYRNCLGLRDAIYMLDYRLILKENFKLKTISTKILLTIIRLLRIAFISGCYTV